jgi:hypothetical protein
MRKTIDESTKPMINAQRSAQIMDVVLAAIVAFTPSMAQAQQPLSLPDCNMAVNAPGNKSGSYGATSVTLFAAPPQGTKRTGMFVECLTASCVVGLGFGGAAATTGASGSLIISGQYEYFNAASFGFIPQGAVTIITNNTASSITAFACPG